MLEALEILTVAYNLKFYTGWSSSIAFLNLFSMSAIK